MAAVGRATPVVRAQTPFPTRLRVLHASPALGQVEIDFNGQEELDEFTYNMVSDWIEVSPGTVRITIHRDRAGINYIVYDAYISAVPDENYDLIIADPLLDEPTLLPAPVDRSPLRPGAGRLSLIHASVALPGLDIAGDAGRVGFSNVPFGQRTEPLQLPAGSYDLEVTAHESGQLVLALPGTAIDAGKVYQIVIYGDPSSTETPVTSATLVDDARTTATTPTPTT
jgi:hypothetical protein